MARRYFYNAIPADLDAQITALVPGAGVTKIDGIVSAVIPNAMVAGYESQQPASALLVEDVPEGADHGLTYKIPAHLLINLAAAAGNSGLIAVCAAAINAEVASRAIIFGDVTGV